MAKKAHITRERERELGKLAQAGDDEARNELVMAHYGFVCFIAKKYNRSGAEFQDMVANGVLGLIEAIERFDTERPTRLLTMAYWPIRRGILSAVKDASIFSTDKSFQRLARYSLEGAIPEEVRRMISLDMMCGGDDVEPQVLGAIIPDDRAEDPVQMAEDREIVDLAKVAVRRMNKREKDIIKLRLGTKNKKPGMSFKAIADAYGLSSERVRVIFARSMEKIRQHLKDEEK